MQALLIVYFVGFRQKSRENGGADDIGILRKFWCRVECSEREWKEVNRDVSEGFINTFRNVSVFSERMSIFRV